MVPRPAWTAATLALVCAVGACDARRRAPPPRRAALPPPHAVPAPAAPPHAPVASAWRAVLLSGGADPENDAVAHERSIALVLRTLDAVGVGPTARRVLFADGDDDTPDVRFEEPDPVARRRLHAIGLLRAADASSLDALDRYRNHSVGPTAAADLATVSRALTDDAAAASRAPDAPPLLLYVTDHGSQGDAHDGGAIVLWGERDLPVRALGALLDRQPPARRVVSVMSQCYGGAFASLLFVHADPRAPVATHDRCGFFAATADRTSAGCSTQADERQYDDYTTWFFAALLGRDRTGRAVEGADADHDGAIGFDEAHWYAVAHDGSTDVPVTTSEEFLRHRYAAVLAHGGSDRWTAREALATARDDLARTTRGLLAAIELPDTTTVGELRRRAARLRTDCWPPGLCESQDALDAARRAAHDAIVRASSGVRVDPNASAQDAVAALGASTIDAWIAAAQPYFSAVERLESVVGDLESASDVREARTERTRRLVELAVLERRAARDGGETWQAFERIRACEASALAGR